MAEDSQKIVLIMGGSGFIGRALSRYLIEKSWKIRILSRSQALHQDGFPCERFVWNGHKIPQRALKNCDAVVNLVGESVADGTWNSEKKEKILSSRLGAVRALSQALSLQQRKPEIVIQASAVGIFGQGDESRICTESSDAGNGFLADVCKEWEKAASDLKEMTRLCIARFGLVLSWDGGALPELWRMYAHGLGSVPGHGRQWTNWIHLSDVILLLERLIDESAHEGVYHLCAPNNCTYQELHQVFCSYTPSFPFLKAPSWAVSLGIGEQSSLFLRTPNVQSVKWGTHIFNCPDITSALTCLSEERDYPGLAVFRQTQWVPASTEVVWKFMDDPRNLERLTPASERLKLLDSSSVANEQTHLLKYKFYMFNIPLNWHAEIMERTAGRSFKDKQIRGPFQHWYHKHEFKPLEGGTLIFDQVEYRLPFFQVGSVVLPFVKKRLDYLFSYRKKALAKIMSDTPGL